MLLVSQARMDGRVPVLAILMKRGLFRLGMAKFLVIILVHRMSLLFGLRIPLKIHAKLMTPIIPPARPGHVMACWKKCLRQDLEGQFADVDRKAAAPNITRLVWHCIQQNNKTVNDVKDN